MYDKDAVVASMLICEMAAFYRTKGISLIRQKIFIKNTAVCSYPNHLPVRVQAVCRKCMSYEYAEN